MDTWIRFVSKKGLDKYEEIKLSASKIAVLNSCPKKFYYRYDYTGNLELPTETPNFYAYRGTAVHNAVDNMVKSFNRIPLVSEVLMIDKKSFVEDCYREFKNLVSEKNIQVSEFLMSEFIQDFQKSWETIQSEWRVFNNFRIESEITFNIKLPHLGQKFSDIKRKYCLYGTVDYILTSPKGEVVVLDGKTSGTVGRFVDDDQIRLYMYMIFLARKVVPKLGGFTYFLKNETKFLKRAYCSEQSIKDFRFNIIKIIKTIENKLYNEKVKLTYCNLCLYKNLCTPYKESKEIRKTDIRKKEDIIIKKRPSKISW